MPSFYAVSTQDRTIQSAWSGFMAKRMARRRSRSMRALALILTPDAITKPDYGALAV